MKKFLLIACLLMSPFLAAKSVSLPSENSLTTALSEAEKLTDENAKKAQVETLQGSLDLLKQITEQKKRQSELDALLNTASNEISKNTNEQQSLKKQLEQPQTDYAKLSLEDANAQAAKLTSQQQNLQTELNQANSTVASQATQSERAQTALTEGATRNQELTKLLAETGLDPALAQKYQLEQALLEQKTSYFQALLKNDDLLNNLYQSRYALLQLKSRLLQNQLTALQEVINQKTLTQTKNQVAQAQQQNAADNPVLQKELEKNSALSELLLKQTEASNILSQDELRMRNVLDNLTQTQRTIDEQISALQGTLVLSRIIQQQKQKLPTNLNIKALSEQISDLRVRIFDITQARNELYDVDAYLTKFAESENLRLNDAEKTTLKKLFEERRTVASELIKTLNTELNLAINLELTQQQIIAISDQLQAKLDQQSFWVKSNKQMDWDWLKTLPMAAKFQIEAGLKKFSFTPNWQNLDILLCFAGILVLIGGVIFKLKHRLTQKLTRIQQQLNTLSNDSQWHTPLALLITGILALPSVLWFLAASLLIGFFAFRTPMEMWQWAITMAGYWWFFAFTLALMRPHGIARQHFGFSTNNVETTRSFIRKMAVATALLLNTSVFSNVSESGITNDVLGEVITIGALIFTIFILAPRFRQAVASFNQETKTGGLWAMTLRMLSIVVPIALTVLIALGYYYTTLVIIQHLVSTYVAFNLWVWGRHTIYRSFTVTSRRLAHHRLEEKRAQLLTQRPESSDEEMVTISDQDEGLTLNEVRSQIQRVADIFIWSALFALLYYVWADLVTVANYLRGIELWTQTSTTDAGTVTESITLFNGLVAMLILTLTYLLVRNIGGVLEVLIFSRVKLSQGTPYTITTLLTYTIVAVGGAWAFAVLGMSWSKLQWLFAALSVGLGFGMQEIFANFVSGLILLFERPIRVGDIVTINNVTGTVSKIRIRAITLIDTDRKEVIMPNKSLVTGQVTNWALSNTVTRLVLCVGVAYGSDLELVRRLLLQAAAEQENVLQDPAPQALFLAFGASTLDHELRVYVGQLAERNFTIDALNRRINQIFTEHGIEIAFNQLDVTIKNSDTGTTFAPNAANVVTMR